MEFVGWDGGEGGRFGPDTQICRLNGTTYNVRCMTGTRRAGAIHDGGATVSFCRCDTSRSGAGCAEGGGEQSGRSGRTGLNGAPNGIDGACEAAKTATEPGI